MPTSAQRFASNATLDRCVDEGHRMVPGEPDHDAVWRLQAALSDLGYNVAGGIDGHFGQGTGDAIVAFKADEALTPGDGVASRGTIGTLDAYYSSETATPDDPDGSTDGLPALVSEAMATASEWITTAVESIERHLAGNVTDSVSQALERNFRLLSGGLDPASALERIVAPVYREARRAFDLGFFEIIPHTRDEWRSSFPNEDYRTTSERAGGRLFVTPAFRNAFTQDERVGNIITFGVGLDGRVDQFASPVTRRFERLNGNDGIRNKLAYSSFAFEVTFGAFATFPPRFVSHEVHF